MRLAVYTWYRAALLVALALMLVKCTTLSEMVGGKGDPTGYGRIPNRPARALSGSKFAEQIKNKSGEAREDLIYKHIIYGNIPNRLRRLRPIQTQAWVGGKKITGTFWVMPDYLSVGSDSDYFLIPMTPLTAQKIADKFGYVLPTRKMVDLIYKSATIKLSPRPKPPSPSMVTTRYYSEHNRTVQSQLRGKNLNQIIAGHKKDVVYTPRLIQRPKQVAIYGWHQSNGKPIQPLSLIHHNQYADYSHGVRLIRNVMIVDGKKMWVKDVLQHPTYAQLISDEGPTGNMRVAEGLRGNPESKTKVSH